MNTLDDIIRDARKSQPVVDAEWYIRLAYLTGKIDGSRETADCIIQKITGGHRYERSGFKS